MSNGLEFNFELETVTFSDLGYPEVSGYGKTVRVKIYSTNKNDVENTIVVNIGGKLFLFSQIEDIVKKAKNFKSASSTFYK